MNSCWTLERETLDQGKVISWRSDSKPHGSTAFSRNFCHKVAHFRAPYLIYG